eukprot:CAMPEP_0195021604 /NCGR_PEP_ID=MMETSP0326_2-20130528/38275_1 /TAXON_ID=2866 ORGANISM="Crypthecodinium cohnii, Strain Seligo" /NCGR_SAMPLE_ID=MMETSP0326_2 /ASSEMBLY_ACC=CAM_ASM_000348 /LENGTH=179 /DNA_ID=CAMNT_0040040885 /DNA_START=219 /DNA_END=755 /DNA_ORIENTATION=+
MHPSSSSSCSIRCSGCIEDCSELSGVLPDGQRSRHMDIQGPDLPSLRDLNASVEPREEVCVDALLFSPKKNGCIARVRPFVHDHAVVGLLDTHDLVSPAPEFGQVALQGSFRHLLHWKPLLGGDRNGLERLILYDLLIRQTDCLAIEDFTSPAKSSQIRRLVDEGSDHDEGQPPLRGRG